MVIKDKHLDFHLVIKDFFYFTSRQTGDARFHPRQICLAQKKLNLAGGIRQADFFHQLRLCSHLLRQAGETYDGGKSLLVADIEAARLKVIEAKKEPKLTLF